MNFGADDAVVGIATDALGSRAVTSDRGAPPAVLLLNAGVLHRVGPHRLHVNLARTLAREGFGSLRIDLSGIGDSRGVPGTMTFRASSVGDVRAAMDLLDSTNSAGQYILFGLCSGADNALAVAEQDRRVVGIILVDSWAYATRRSAMRKLAQRVRQLRSPASIAAWLFKVGGSRLSRSIYRRLARSASIPSDQSAPSRVAPPRADHGRDLSGLIQRGIKILCIYSGANDAGYNHQDQFFEVFPALRGRVEVLYFPMANHVFTELAARKALLESVNEWCTRQFG